MKFNIPLDKNTIALMLTGFVTFGFFFGGLFDVLNLMILKALLFIAFSIVLTFAVYFLFKNSDKKNRPEEIPQDDLH